MNKRYLMALDQGTTSSRAILFTFEGAIIAQASLEFAQHYPKPGWVEYDPADILQTQIEAMRACVRKAGIDASEIAGIGITNQRETTLVWERKTGQCVHNAIVWQCRRTADQVESLHEQGCDDLIREKTGLIPDAYFSAS
ncbi:MAG: glycerol kinase, partial [Clostridia bacterium]|nr:glycerol kinase [Clostridia bacterium]